MLISGTFKHIGSFSPANNVSFVTILSICDHYSVEKRQHIAFITVSKWHIYRTVYRTNLHRCGQFFFAIMLCIRLLYLHAKLRDKY